MISQLEKLHNYLVLSDDNRAKLLYATIKKIKYLDKQNDMPKFNKYSQQIVQEYTSTGQIKELIKFDKSKKMQGLIILTSILGVGRVTATDWVNKKIYNLEDLRLALGKQKIKLNHMQEIGLRYYYDLHLRIPRSEITQIGESLRQIINTTHFHIAGSYRRGSPDSGDIDIIITNDDLYLDKFKKILMEQPYYVDIISCGSERLTFIIKMFSHVRQVDLLCVEVESFFAALLYFTGSWDFNEAMRAHAKIHGFRLNQHGLYKDNTLVHTVSEEDIFDKLGLKYVSPNYRISYHDVIIKNI